MSVHGKNISPSDIKGLLVHDPDDTWKKKRISGMGDKNVCVTWDVMPLQEILESLSKIIEQNLTFDLYYLKGNETAYKATVIDFSTKKEYKEKVSDLRWTGAPTFQDDFDKYDSGKNGVKVVFLASKFEEIKKENRRKRENFEIYNPTYSRQKQIMAYTKILTDDEIKNKNMIDQFINLLKSNSNLVLTGAPGTGKTYLAKQIAKKMIGVETDEDLKNSGQYDFVQFHPSYDYTDFVEGLRPTKPDDNGNIGFKRQDGVFKSFCKAALMNFRANGNNKEKADKFVFVIDEINRGDISKIFGELFFSIDPGYRGKDGRVQTQYQNMIDKDGDDEFKDGFYVPENVYIIGTMNDIDRSVESMDFAMRRRFAWKEIKAKDTQNMLDDLGDDEMIDTAKKRMYHLNKEIEKEEIGLNSAYHIGAAYFMKLANYDGDLKVRFEKLWENHLEGVLREYLRGADDVEGKIHKLHDAYDKKD